MPPPPQFQIVPTDVPPGLRLIGELDLATAQDLREALATLPDGQSVTLDLSELSFVDSTGLHVIVQYAASTNGAGPLKLVNVPSEFTRILEITSLHQHPRLEIASR